MNSETSTDTLIKKLEGSSEYKVLKRLSPPRQYNTPDGTATKTAVYLDLETTGLNYETDEIIEIALVPFRYSTDGKIFELLEPYNELREPKSGPISEEITKITGITNEMVKGRSIDLQNVIDIVFGASLIIAHNADFDRKFAEAEFESFNTKPWACSMSQIPWREEGLDSGKLEYLAMKSGFFYDAHRATTDCYAGIELLSRRLPKSRRLALDLLLTTARKDSHRIWAEQAPFDFKDILKGRGYRWNDGNDGRPKAWYCDVNDDALDAELKFLSDEIYQRNVDLHVSKISAVDRFSIRV
ncbi:MAG: 3'-5' exonuclease [Bacteroidetes Order II. Incertae sedis bacterium]|jgi:DNA polymerase III subunit epsilon|nr:3'-5' exonuclease [Bacteroidetes Order II. bacterium]